MEEYIKRVGSLWKNKWKGYLTDLRANHYNISGFDLIYSPIAKTYWSVTFYCSGLYGGVHHSDPILSIDSDSAQYFNIHDFCFIASSSVPK